MSFDADSALREVKRMASKRRAGGRETRVNAAHRTSKTLFVVFFASLGLAPLSTVFLLASTFLFGALVMSLLHSKLAVFHEVTVERVVEQRVECHEPCCLATRRLEQSTAGDSLSMGYFETMGPNAKAPRSIVDIESEVTAPVAHRATRKRDAS